MIFVTLKLKVFSSWLCVDKQIIIPHLPFIVSPYGGLIWAIDDDEVSAAVNTCSGGQYFPSQSPGSSAKKNAPKSSLNRGLHRLIVTPVWGGLQISRFTLGNSVMQQNYIHWICSPGSLILKGKSKCLAFCYFFFRFYLKMVRSFLLLTSTSKILMLRHTNSTNLKYLR